MTIYCYLTTQMVFSPQCYITLCLTIVYLSILIDLALQLLLLLPLITLPLSRAPSSSYSSSFSSFLLLFWSFFFLLSPYIFCHIVARKKQEGKKIFRSFLSVAGVVFDFTVLGKKMMLQFLNFSDIKAVSSLCDVYFKKRTAIQILYNYLLVREVILPEVVAILPSWK